jgi:FkbM family methyltransferase
MKILTNKKFRNSIFFKILQLSLTGLHLCLVRSIFLRNIVFKVSQGRDPSSYIVKIFPKSHFFPKHNQVTLQRGGIWYNLDLHDSIDWSIYLGLRELGHEKLLHLCREDAIVIDIGSNVGAVLMKIATKCSDGMVFGFEPSPENFRRLTSNLSLNSFQNVSVFNYALGERAGESFIRVVNEANRGMNTIQQSDDSTGILIDVKTLDSFIEDSRLQRLDVIKIDVEGYETKVIHGAAKTLKKFKPIIFFELDDMLLRGQHSSASELVGLLTFFYGYSCVDAVTGAIITVSTSFDGYHGDIIATA